jgi:hypothetical protein
VDLFGEHSVQVVAATLTTMLEAALVLTLAALIVLLSVRVAQQAASIKPVCAIIVPQHMTRIAPPARDADDPSVRWLSTSLPTRAPPPGDPGSPPSDRWGRRQERFRPSPPGARRSGE